MDALHTQKLLSVEDVSELVGYDRRKVLRAIRAGELVAFDITPSGSRRPEYRIHPRHYDEWLAAKLVMPAVPVHSLQRERAAASEAALNAAYRAAA